MTDCPGCDGKHVCPTHGRPFPQYVTTETATVYRARGRRFLTRRAAYSNAAKAKIDEVCDCIPPDCPCRWHDGVEPGHTAAVVERLASLMMVRDARCP